MKWLCFFFLLFTVPAWAQQKITGRLISAGDNQPIVQASVFLANATIGTTSNNEGYFTLSNVRPGQYELVVSIVGFDVYRTTLLISNTDIDLKAINLIPKAIQLTEVVIKPDEFWFAKYETFKREFLGSSPLAAKCRILNPEVLTLDYGENKLVLNGSSDEFLEIENLELGYKIKYLLTNFFRDGRRGYVYYQGSPLFQEMKGKPSQVKKWIKNRQKAYLGSTMHFLRSTIGNNITEEGYEVRRLIRQKDSTQKGPFAKVQMLVKTPLAVTDFVKLTDQRGIYALQFADFLYVMYTKKRQHYTFRPNYMPADAPPYVTSVLGFEEIYGFFDSNGVLLNPGAIVFEGHWSGERVAEMLPVDYVPPAQL